MILTRKQRKALHNKWIQSNQGMTYRQFRKTVLLGWTGEIMVQWCGMWLGIETDGYTHS